MPFPRKAGILLHPTSLPGGNGIGDLGAAAFRFVDFLAEADIGLWQMLPLGPTGAANSPYQALSSFAGNPLLVSLAALAEERLLTSADLSSSPDNTAAVNFDRARSFKEETLRLAFSRFQSGKSSVQLQKSFETFCEEEKSWLDDFALFMAAKSRYAGAAWFQWKESDLAHHRNCEEALKEMADEVAFQSFCQFIFFSQWRALRAYANEKGIRLIGDLPIYVAHDSADVWATPEIFKLDKKGMTDGCAGVPPDYFSPTGQLWGNPLYRWNLLKKSGYRWWLNRFKAGLALVDILRIDHFRGFEAYWAVPKGDETAINGKWIKGPGQSFFDALKKELGDNLPVIAEDLGIITEPVDRLRLDNRLPGMKVLQFAFHVGAEMYQPHTSETNTVVYTATHDNDTTRGWYNATGTDYEHMDRGELERERDHARRYLGRDGTGISWDMIRLALSSVADTAIFPMQDVLDLDNDARMNRPGITDGQWLWRMTDKQLADAPAERLADMIQLYGRRQQDGE